MDDKRRITKKAANGRGASPSVSKKPSKSAKPSPPPTPVDSIRDVKARRELTDACTEIRGYQEQIASLELLKKDLIANHVAPLVERLKLQKVAGDDWLLIRVPPQKRLNVNKLLE